MFWSLLFADFQKRFSKQVVIETFIQHISPEVQVFCLDYIKSLIESDTNTCFIAFAWNAKGFVITILVFLLVSFFGKTGNSYFQIFLQLLL